MNEITPELRARIAAAVDCAAAEEQTVPGQVERMQAAAAEETFSGRLRRAFCRRPAPLHATAQAINADPMLLQKFLEGQATLPSDLIDRLTRYLGLSLIFDPATTEHVDR